ncbi:MAG: glycosyltransferase family 9 protein [Candidatus Pacearchaeota archaeon]|nr:glycosyltransferase family 9 protein [Candidatus Pacearchaeota archaeon]
MKILILPMGGIGNMLMFLPTLEKLHKEFPEAKITVISDEDPARYVLENISYINLIVYQKLLWSFALKLRKENFDICLLPYLSGGIRKVLFAKLAGCKKIISHPYFLFNEKSNFLLYSKTDEKKQHDVESNLDLLKPLGIKIINKDKKIKMPLPKNELTKAMQFFQKNKIKGKIIGIHPGSTPSTSYKRWPANKYLEIIKTLLKNKYTILVFFGPGEEELIKEFPKKSRLFLVAKKTLNETAALISKCNLFLSNDSGLMHLAVSQNVPTIGLFGPTIFWRTSPYGAQNITLKTNFPCVPCYNPYKFNLVEQNCQRNLICIKSIPIKRVEESIKKIEKRK